MRFRSQFKIEQRGPHLLNRDFREVEAEQQPDGSWRIKDRVGNVSEMPDAEFQATYALIA